MSLKNEAKRKKHKIMKVNWGTGIVLAFVLFIGFILFFVIKTNTDKKANYDLVTEEYYKAELAYQDEIDAATNARKLVNPVKIRKKEGGLLIEFPAEFDPKLITGLVSLYRPSNKQLDFSLPLSLSNTHLLIPGKRLLDGRWDIKIVWEYKGESYLNKKQFSL